MLPPLLDSMHIPGWADPDHRLRQQLELPASDLLCWAPPQLSLYPRTAWTGWDAL